LGISICCIQESNFNIIKSNEGLYKNIILKEFKKYENNILEMGNIAFKIPKYIDINIEYKQYNHKHYFDILVPFNDQEYTEHYI